MEDRVKQQSEAEKILIAFDEVINSLKDKSINLHNLSYSIYDDGREKEAEPENPVKDETFTDKLKTKILELVSINYNIGHDIQNLENLIK